jgi:uncharacterized protein
MGGTRIGGKRCAATNKARHGEDYYSRIGAIGGKNGHTGGFHNNRELARRARAIGGRISRRGLLIRKDESYATRADDGAVTVYDRKRGLVVSDQVA